MATITGFNPFGTTNAGGFFGVFSDGFTQGVAHDDPASRFWLSGGYLASTETLPMWGGVAISEYVPPQTNPYGHAGGSIGRATSAAGITGFSVFNQSHNGINWPQSQVPTIQNGMSVNFYRLGSNARIPVACDPSLVSLDGGLITQQVSWDFNNQRLQPYDASSATYAVTSITSSYSATTGLYTFAVVMAVPSLVGAVGDTINISGVTGTGNALVNGNQTVTSFTDNEHFSFQIAAASGAIATGALSGTIVLNAGTGLLPCKILMLQVGNSRTVAWNPVTLTANWNNSDTCALIQI